MRPNERGWRGQEGESEREDVLYILQVPEKGSREEMRGGIESFLVHRIRCEELRSRGGI